MNISTNRLFILGAENADAHAWPIADRPPPSFRGPWIARSNGMKMTTRPVEIDYLIAGADAVSMALAECSRSQTRARVAFIDKRDQPDDASPFMHLYGRPV
jgi:hypothetical protein